MVSLQDAEKDLIVGEKQNKFFFFSNHEFWSGQCLRGEDGPVHVSPVAAGGDAAAGAGHLEREVAEHHAAVAALHAGAGRVRQRRRHAEQAATVADVRNTKTTGPAQLGLAGCRRRWSKKIQRRWGRRDRRLLQVARAAAALDAAVGGDRVGPVRHGQAGVGRVRRERRRAR